MVNSSRGKLRKSSRLSLREFTRLAGKVVDEVPPRLLRELNGGFVVVLCGAAGRGSPWRLGAGDGKCFGYRFQALR
jgi:hypothetical protein